MTTEAFSLSPEEVLMVATATPGTDRTLTTAGTRRLRRALTVGAAATAALLDWVVLVPVSGVHLRVENSTGTSEVGAAAVVIFALLAGFAGWALLAALERCTSRPRRTWTVIASVTLVVSMVGPLSGATAAATGALSTLHLVTAAVLISGLRSFSRHR
jgi:Family of unknown function (DUF6069)